MNTRSEAALPPLSAPSMQMGATPVAPPESLRTLMPGMLYRALRWGVSDTEVVDLMRRVCAVARQEGVQPEHVVVSLKRAWRELPEVRRMLRDVRESTLNDLISLCIEEYFPPLGVAHHRP